MVYCNSPRCRMAGRSSDREITQRTLNFRCETPVIMMNSEGGNYVNVV
jgi:hypothetical protein